MHVFHYICVGYILGAKQRKMKTTIIKPKLYYIGINKETRIAYIATTKMGIARLLEISHDSVSRYLKDITLYDQRDYYIYRAPISKTVKKPFTFKWH